MPYKIENVSLQGVRGFNKLEKLSLNEGVTLLYGENGSGKSSLLQAIEWAITGNIPFMKGGDFAHEDAIVNLFNKSKKAFVEIGLSNQYKSMTISRTRKMSSRTTSGKQPLEVKSPEHTLKDQEAELELRKALNISLEEFSQSKYLHQETIREILNAKPEERSQAIDKLIGTYEIREFAKTIDAERKVNSSIKAVQETLDSVKRDKIQFLLNLKRSLGETKLSLVKKGKREQDLTISNTLDNLVQSKESADLLSKKYVGQQSAGIDIQPNVQSLIQAQRSLLNQLNTLDRARLETINRISIQKTSIGSSSKRYEELYTQLQGMRHTSSQTLVNRIGEIDEELGNIDLKIREIGQKLTALPHKRSIYETNKALLESENSKLNKIRGDFGTIEEIDRKIEEEQEKFTTIQSNLDKLSGQQSLLSMAIEQLEATKTSECPICLSDINNEELTKELKQKISGELAAAVESYRETQKAIKYNKRILEEKLEDSKRISTKIHDLDIGLVTDAEQLRSLVPNFENENLDETPKGWENEIKELSDKTSELRGEQNKLKDMLTRLSQLTGEVERLENELQEVTSSKSEGPELLVKIEELSQILDQKIAEYSDSSEVDRSRIILSNLAEILNYLNDEEQVKAAEKELPMVENQIKGLEVRIKQLQALASSLQSIKQVAIQYEKEAAIAELNRLENDINDYYSKIQGHPYFTRIKIYVEKEDPLIFSIRAASAQEDTSIPTRFSTAQLNAVAIAIFMAYNNHQVGDLPMMILDDPTQNMDNPHKEAFAKLIATLYPQKQVIIATEDADTRRFLEKHCVNIQTYEFSNWTQNGTEIKVA